VFGQDVLSGCLGPYQQDVFPSQKGSKRLAPDFHPIVMKMRSGDSFIVSRDRILSAVFLNPEEKFFPDPFTAQEF
jgi:hypothetical protein